MPLAGALVAPSGVSARNRLPDFSLDEEHTGLWIDGMPIFQKTVELLPFTAASQTLNTPHGIVGMVRLIGLYGMADNGDIWRPLPYASWHGGANITLQATRTNVTVQTGSIADTSINRVFAILRYTKQAPYLVTHTVGSWQATDAGEIGIWFVVGARRVKIISIGRLWNPADNTAETQMNFYRRVGDSSTLLANAVINHGENTGIRWVWTDLATPWIAEAGMRYLIRYTRQTNNRYAAVSNVTVPSDFTAFGRSSEGNTDDPTLNVAWGPIDFRYYAGLRPRL